MARGMAGTGNLCHYEIRETREMVRYVLSWQPDITVLRQTALRDRVHETMRAALAGVDAAGVPP